MEMKKEHARAELKRLIAAGDLATVSRTLNGWEPASIAALLSELSVAEQTKVFDTLKPEIGAVVFEYLSFPTQEQLLQAFSNARAAEILNEMAADDRTALLEALGPALSTKFFSLLEPEQKEIASSLLKFGKNSVGRLMTPDYVAIPKEWTVKQVLDHVRTHGKDSETLSVIYVTDADNKLIDDIRIREFLLAPLHLNVSDIMDNEYVCLKVTDEANSAAEVFNKYNRSALPVVDLTGHLVGIVTIDDVLSRVEKEATREIQRLGAVEALDLPYRSTPLPTLIRKRATWLVVLFLGEMLTATAMGFFEAEIQKAVVLALFVPLIISSGGNSGSQAATLIVRSLALGEIRLRDWWMVMKREMLSGLSLGIILGTIGFCRIAVWSSFSPIYGPHWLLIGLTVAFSLVGIVLWGTLSGSMLPFLLKRMGLDPATSSAPFVATLVDVTGLVVYFSVAAILLRGTLL